MFQRKISVKIISVLCVTILLAACRLASPPTPTVFPTKTPASTSTFVPTNTITPTASPTFSGPAAEIEKPTGWNIYDPHEPNLPELIVPDANGFRLDPQWQVVKIEYAYHSWTSDEGGLASRSAMSDEIIEKNAAGYQWGNKKITTEQINAFLATIINLHPVEALRIGIFHTDDYPSWQLELTGADGNHILLFSASDENPGFGPWHVIYNGRIYAQYDGTLGPAIGKLFVGTDDSFIWEAHEPQYHPADLVSFNSSGLPNQLSYGFTGLLPIAESFNYKANFAEVSEIQASIQSGIDYIDGRTIKVLDSVELSVNGKPSVCKINKPEEIDYPARWMFSCRIGVVTAGQRYHYPLRLKFVTDTGEKFVTTGELLGVWQNPAIVALPPGEEIQAAIDQNPDFQDLLKDQIFYTANYTGKMDLGKDKSPLLLGKIVLSGQARVANHTFSYTVTAPFGIIEHKFVEWRLTRQQLQHLIAYKFESYFSSCTSKESSRITLNFLYSVDDGILGNFPAMPGFHGVVDPYSGIGLSECEENPAVELP